MSSGALSILGWWFLPSMVSGWLQSLYYSIIIRAGTPHPAPGTRRYATHRRIIQTLVISAYLIYTIIEADHEIAVDGNYYSALGVSPTATEREIKSRFRRLAAIHHPDKTAPSETPVGADYFMLLKTASDTLLDPAKRFAYDRMGPAIHGMQHCVTTYDYLSKGALERLVPHYVGTAIVLYVLGFFGMLEAGKFWRWLLLLAMATAESSLLTRPAVPSAWQSWVNPTLGFLAGRAPYVQFQIINLLRRLSITLAIALAQLSPVLFDSAASATGEKAEAAALTQSLGRLDSLVAGLDKEVMALMGVEIGPFKDDAGRISELRGQVSEWLVLNTIRSDPMVVDAMGNELRKRRVDAPHGAKGRRTEGKK